MCLAIAKSTFGLTKFDTLAVPTVFLSFSQHKRISHPLALTSELHQPPMMDYPIYGRRRELLISQHGAPFAELDVGGEYEAAALAAAGDNLEQQPRALRVYGDVAELVEYHQVALLNVGQVLVERFLAACLQKREDETRRAEEPHGPAGAHGSRPHRYGQVRLAASGLAVEREVE